MEPSSINTAEALVTTSSDVVMDEESLDSDFLAVTEHAQYIYLFLSVFGVVLNIYVLSRLIIQARTNVGRFLGRSVMPLATMTVADLVSLLVIFLFNILSNHELHQSARDIHCKVSMFFTHTMTGVSKWCWMVASTQRYFAVYHPFSNLNRFRWGPRAIFAIVVMSAAMNSWLLIVVEANETSCTEAYFIVSYDNINRSLHAVEIGWSFLVPVLLAGAMDARVFLTQPPRNILRVSRNLVIYDTNTSLLGSSRSLTQTFLTPKHLRSSVVRRPPATIARLALIRWLLFTTVDLLLNAPDNTIRLLTLVGLLCEDCAIPWNPSTSGPTSSIVIFARLLYFAQFSFNAVFLTTVIYRQRNIRRSATPTPFPANTRSRQATVL